MRVLLTGFQPMQGEASNASEVLVRSIGADPPPALTAPPLELSARILPTDSANMPDNLRALIDEIDPDCALFFGQARGRSQINFERFAVNLLDFSRADGTGRICTNQPIDPAGPAAYAITVDGFDRAAEALRARGIPAACSNHAGTSLCNQLLYLGLRLAEQAPHRFKAGFIHIPALPEQVLEENLNVPFMSLEMLREAVEIAIPITCEIS